jgi:hypothetical protein
MVSVTRLASYHGHSGAGAVEEILTDAYGENLNSRTTSMHTWECFREHIIPLRIWRSQQGRLGIMAVYILSNPVQKQGTGKESSQIYFEQGAV